MSRWVSTWFYEQSSDEGGSYAQVRGESSSQEFRDIYRRCIATFFATARRIDPEVELVLHLNRPWDPSASRTACEVAGLLDRLGVRRVVLEYTYAPPPSWPNAWRNQFFVLDVLADLAARLEDGDLALVLDSDIVWSGAGHVDDLWETLSARGALTYTIDYSADYVVNGCSRRQLSALARHLGMDLGDRVLDYSGGEFVALRGVACGEVVDVATRIWPLAQHARDEGFIDRIEEAHLLSLCYAELGLQTGEGNRFVKRMWTQPLRHQNVRPGDEDFALWHLPAEKRYGLRRLYGDLGLDGFDSVPSGAYTELLHRRLGVPANSRTKVMLDVTAAVRQRAVGMISRASR